MAKQDDLHTVNMTVEEWEAVPANWVQRDTESHATKASRPGKHLSKPHDVHRNVSAALLPSGKYIKLDGHSRSFLWSEGLLSPMPGKLLVTVYPVKNKQEAIEWFRTFDNSSATQTKKDRLFGAFRLHGFHPHHGYLFHNSGLMSAIEYVTSFGAPNKAAVRELPFDVMVKPWLETLRVLDSGDFTNHYSFRSPVMCAALLTIRRDGNKALSFWQSYHDSGGDKKGKKCDGIYAAESLFRTMREEVENRWGNRVLSVYVPYFLFAFDQWWNNNTMAPFGNVLHKRLPNDMFTVQEWFQTCIDEKYDHVKEFPKQQELALDEI